MVDGAELGIGSCLPPELMTVWSLLSLVFGAVLPAPQVGVRLGPGGGYGGARPPSSLRLPCGSLTIE